MGIIRAGGSDLGGGQCDMPYAYVVYDHGRGGA